MSAPVYLASCAACCAYSENGGGVTTYACEVPPPDPFYCPRCRPGLVPPDELAQPEEAVGLVDASPEARWVVLARTGDTVTIRPLGLHGAGATVHTMTPEQVREALDNLDDQLNAARKEVDRRAGL